MVIEAPLTAQPNSPSQLEPHFGDPGRVIGKEFSRVEDAQVINIALDTCYDDLIGVYPADTVHAAMATGGARREAFITMSQPEINRRMLEEAPELTDEFHPGVRRYTGTDGEPQFDKAPQFDTDQMVVVYRALEKLAHKHPAEDAFDKLMAMSRDHEKVTPSMIAISGAQVAEENARRKVAISILERGVVRYTPEMAQREEVLRSIHGAPDSTQPMPRIPRPRTPAGLPLSMAPTESRSPYRTPVSRRDPLPTNTGDRHHASTRSSSVRSFTAGSKRILRVVGGGRRDRRNKRLAA